MTAPRMPVLHAVRLLGFADTASIAIRARRTLAEAADALTDAESRGWVEHSRFADLRGWSLTEAGRAEDEGMLAAERRRADPGGEVDDVYEAFLPLNARLLRACTNWQVRPVPGDAFAANDHTDPGWDELVLGELGAVGIGLGPLVRRLTAVLPRFAGYEDRFELALRRARAGERGWVDRSDVDSCHRVWFELHEDMVATLGIDRSAER